MEEMEMSFRLGIAVSSKVGSETYASGFNKLTGKTSNYDGIWSIWAEFLAYDEKKAAAD